MAKLLSLSRPDSSSKCIRVIVDRDHSLCWGQLAEAQRLAKTTGDSSRATPPCLDSLPPSAFVRHFSFSRDILRDVPLPPFLFALRHRLSSLSFYIITVNTYARYPSRGTTRILTSIRWADIARRNRVTDRVAFNELTFYSQNAFICAVNFENSPLVFVARPQCRKPSSVVWSWLPGRRSIDDTGLSQSRVAIFSIAKDQVFEFRWRLLEDREKWSLAEWFLQGF